MDQIQDAHPLNPEKLALIDRAFGPLGARSFADLGGVWGVEGGYSLYTADRHDTAASFLVDTHPSIRVRERLGEQSRVSLVQGNFGDPAVAAQVEGVDALFLFDVLLHQAAPPWDKVLALYAWAPILVIYNQQWTGPETVRLLDLGEEEFFRHSLHQADKGAGRGLFGRLDQRHPDHGGLAWRDVHHLFQYGITDRDLFATLERLGYRLDFFKNIGRFGGLPKFEDHAMIFTKADRG